MNTTQPPAATPRTASPRHLVTALLSALVAALLMGSGISTAQAGDTGGVMNPIGCKDAYTVRSVTLKNSNGTKAGYLDLRWSDSCNVQWARIRTTGAPAAHLAATVKESKTNNAAYTDEYKVASAWTRGIRLQNGRNSEACAYGDLFNTAGKKYASGRVCF